jgi:wobble nucleotide-excising tRNase
VRQENEKRTSIRRQITEKEETLTSVLPTASAINAILERFGFTGFKLAENGEAKGTYKIIRSDGSNAKKTLSEGEHNFISFLYFFHLVYGSFERSGIDKNKVVVIDDPISSLDSNVLFIITTLTKTLITDCIANKHGVKQIFIFTHNVYFYKEITFRGSRSEYPSTRTAYWVIRKREEVSSIVKFDKNPIQTSYELLWSDLKDAENTQRVTVFNTLRRILEYYFNIIGGLDYEKCIDKFDGQDKIVCKALIASINDGSHFISDDFVMCYESDTLENYLRVFRLIFHEMGHENHYKMMMRETGDYSVKNEEQLSTIELVQTIGIQ